MRKTLKISEELHQRIKVYCVINKIKMSEWLEETISEKLKVPMDMYVCEDSSPMKYGMPKIYKDIFNQNPERFELRIDYPDMPACPFGNSFKALGNKKEKREYIWMVTSIIKDDRLKKVVYAK